MEDFFTRSELLVERDGGGIAVIGLNVDHPGVALRSNIAQVLDDGSRDTLPPMLCGDREVVDIQLFLRPFELIEFVSDQPAENVFARPASAGAPS
jgi:hypothetical protein